MSEAQQPAATIGHLTGQVIGGRYRLGERLGQGGMGVVYTATQESLARPVAVKVLQPMLAQNGESILRFRAEAERAGRLAHPHIVQILDFGHEIGTSAWIAMELLKGESLAARIERGPLSEAEVVRVAKETLSALEAAHGANLVHRDLKPDNIFLADVPGIGASVKVLDFGIAKLLDDDSAAKLTATGMLIGTPLYMAPEQARGADVDQRADLYALGAVLYEALTGKPPFTGKNYNALLYSVLSEAPLPIASVRPDVSPDLARVIARAMEKDPAKRWESAHAMAEALRAVHPSEHMPIMRAAGDAAIGTAATMATPVPAEPFGATTPALGATGDVGSSVARATPPTRTTPAPERELELQSPLAAPAPTPAPAPRAIKTEQGFRWWPIALAGGALAVATFAFVGVNGMSGAEGEPAVAFAPVSMREVRQDTAPLAVVHPADDAPPPVQAPVVTGSPSTQPQTGAPDDTDSEAPDRPPPRIVRPTTTIEAASTRGVPRATVVVGAIGFQGMSSSAAVRGPITAAGGWADCWPSDVPAPTRDQSRAFLLDVDADGAVLSARPRPTGVQTPAFASCVVAKLERITFAPPATGAVVHLTVDFSIGVP